MAGSSSCRARSATCAPNAASVQGSGFLDYRIGLLPGLSVNGGYYYVGDRPLNAANTVTVPGYGRLDLGARYATLLGGLKTTFRGSVVNALDTRYWAAASYGSVWMGRARTAMLSADFEY